MDVYRKCGYKEMNVIHKEMNVCVYEERNVYVYEEINACIAEQNHEVSHTSPAFFSRACLVFWTGGVNDDQVAMLQHVRCSYIIFKSFHHSLPRFSSIM